MARATPFIMLPLTIRFHIKRVKGYEVCVIGRLSRGGYVVLVTASFRSPVLYGIIIPDSRREYKWQIRVLHCRYIPGRAKCGSGNEIGDADCPNPYCKIGKIGRAYARHGDEIEHACWA